MTRARFGLALAAIALWLQVLVPALAARAELSADRLDRVAILCHGDGTVPSGGHAICPLCPLCSAAHVFLPAEAPVVPLPPAPLLLSLPGPTAARPREAEPPRARARAPPAAVAA